MDRSSYRQDFAQIRSSNLCAAGSESWLSSLMMMVEHRMVLHKKGQSHADRGRHYDLQRILRNRLGGHWHFCLANQRNRRIEGNPSRKRGV
ncbi:hypothetical protein ACLOJK_028347 [Asimina triloba]